MPAFTVYGFHGSTNTDRIRLTLAEAGFTDYEMTIVNLAKGEQKSSANMSRHPWGKVPAVEFSDGFVLYESRSICKYLCRLYGFPLLPPESDIKASALFDQAESVESSYFAEPAGKISFEKYAKRLRGLPADEVVVATALQGVEAFFEIADRLLSQRAYMAGNDFTLVDISYIPLIQRLVDCGYGHVINSNSYVSAWWDRCTSRSGLQELMAADRMAAAAAASR